MSEFLRPTYFRRVERPKLGHLVRSCSTQIDNVVHRPNVPRARPREASGSTHDNRRYEGCPAGTHRRFAALGWRAVPQLAVPSRAAIPPFRCPRSRTSCAAASGACRWRRCPSVNPLDTWTRAARQRPARHLARPLHGADRDRRLARAHRSGVGTARFAVALRRPEALSARADRDSRAAAARCGDRLARSLRPPRLHDDARCAQRDGAVRHVARRRRAPRSLRHRARSASSSSTGGNRIACRAPDLTLHAAPSQHFSGRGLKDGNRTLWSSLRHRVAAASRVLQRRHRAHAPSTREIRARLGPVRPRDARGRRVSSRLGRHSSRARRTRSRRTPCSAAGRCCPCTGAPSISRCMRGTSRPRRWCELAPKAGARLVMPRLGEPVEPSHERAIEPWWRGVDADVRQPRSDGAMRMPKAMPWPPD